MEDKTLRQLNRQELIELLLEQKKRNDALEAELEEVKKQLEDRDILISESGSIAEAALKLSGIFEDAQKAADMYLSNIRRQYRGMLGENEKR